MRVRLSYLSLGFAWVALVAFSLVGRKVLPSKYYKDSDRMGAIAASAGADRVSKSDALTAHAYAAVGLSGADNSWAAGIIGGTVAFVILALIIRQREIGLPEAILLIPWLLFTALYLSMFSKELLTTILVALVTIGTRDRRVLWLGLIAVFLYGGFGRAYWLLMLGIGGGVWFVVRLKAGYAIKAALLGLGLAAMLVAVKVATGIYLTDAREMLAAFRGADANSQTLVHNFVPNRSILHDGFNLVGGWLRFLLPVSLIRYGGAQHFVFCVLQITTTVTVIWHLIHDPRRKARFGTPERREFDLTIAIGVAVTIGLAAFDADFGSYARHQVSLVPWLVQVFAISGRIGSSVGEDALVQGEST